MAEIKPVRGLERKTLSEIVPLSMPMSIQICLTDSCNFKCNYCYHSLTSNEREKIYNMHGTHMSNDTYDKIVNDLTNVAIRYRGV